MTVRIATPADLPELMRLLRLMHAEGGLFPLDEGRAKAMFELTFDRKGGIIGVLGEPGKLAGFIGLLITSFWYTRSSHLEEVFNFIDPDHRKSNHARTLIDFAKSCADEIGIPLVIGVMTNRRVVEKVRLYRRALGFPAGAYFVYGGKWVSDMTENPEFWRTPFPAHSEKRKGAA